MQKTLRYAICTVALIIGLTVYLYGSKLITDTYQRESIYIESVKIGRMPVEEHLALVKCRGLKDGLIDLFIQFAGVSVTLISFCALLYTGRK